jgi:hypothetical protein
MDRSLARGYANEGLRKLAAGYGSLRERPWSDLTKLYLTKTAQPIKVANAVKRQLTDNACVLTADIDAPSKISEARKVDFVTANAPDSQEFKGICLAAHSLFLEKKVGHYVEGGSYVCVTHHAIERFIQRTDEAFSVLVSYLAAAAHIVPAFNSRLCYDTYGAIPICLPVHDGLLLGQSETASYSDLSGIIFNRSGAQPFKPPAHNLAILLGNPPRRMFIKTFIGAHELRTAQSSVSQNLIKLIDEHRATLKTFGRAAMHSQGDMSIGIEGLTNVVFAEARKLVGLPDIGPDDPLLTCFPNPEHRDAFRNFLDDYKEIVTHEQFIREIVEPGLKHLG